jgi:chitinase
MTRRLLVLVLGIAAFAVPGVAQSGADFTAASSTPSNSMAAAADFNTIAVAMSDPGSPLSGPVTLAATASADPGIATVAYQAQLGGGGWATVCTATSAPWSCSWDTRTATSGTYALRAIATDSYGRTRTSATVASRVVTNPGPGIALADPGPSLTGTRTLTATATDVGGGVASVAIAHRRVGDSTWTTICTGTTATLSCAFDSTQDQQDGDVELRAGATDAVGNVRFSTPITRRVDNTAPSAANTAGATLRGTGTLTSSVSDGAGTGVASVKVQIRPQGQSAWTDACSATSAPWSCTYATTSGSTPDGVYELRTLATDGAGLVGTSATVTTRIDNTAPATPTLADPGTPITAAVTLSGTASDTGSGIASWRVEYRTSPSGTWTTACTDTVAPWGSCSWTTTAVADGLYDLRAVATDVAGNAATSATVSSRRVDNNGPTTSLADPGAYLAGTIALSATATDPVGVTSVAFQRKATGGTMWTTICTDATAPYTCSWTTTGVADGDYDLRAQATDSLGHVSYSTVADRIVDNTAPAPVDVQAGNGGATAGKPEAGDWIAFTWSEQVAPASILAGWNGAATAISVTFVDANKRDTLSLDNATLTTPLNIASTKTDVALNEDYVSADTTFDATMVQTGRTIKVTLGAKRGTSAVKTAAAATMTWKVNNATTDLAGNAITANAQVTEAGAVDADF